MQGCMNVGMQEYRNVGMQERNNVGMQKYKKNVEMQECMNV